MKRFKNWSVLVLILSFILLVTGCSGSPDEEINNIANNIIQGTVTLNGEPVSEVKVDIENYEIQPTTTDQNGVYSFSNLPDGSYNLHFERLDKNIDETKEVVVAGDKTVTADLNITPQETSIQDAQEFITNLKTHGIHLKEVGQAQANKIKNNFNQDIVPYMTAVGYRMNKVNNVLDAWSHLAGLWNGRGPGDYTIDLTALQEYEYQYYSTWPDDHFTDYYNYETNYQNNYSNLYDSYEDYYFAEHTDYNSFAEYIANSTGFIVSKTLDQNPHDLSVWEWNMTFSNLGETVVLKITNPHKIATYEEIASSEYEYYSKETIDFTKAEFSYSHISNIDPNFDWSLDFTFNSEATDTFEGTDEYYGEMWDSETGEYVEDPNTKYRHDYTVFLPTKATAQLTGTITDNQIYYNSLGEELPAIGTITLDATANLDFEANDAISYQGMFNSKEFNYTGSANIQFIDMPSYQSIHDGITYPQLSTMDFSGELSTNVFNLSGSSKIDFVGKEATFSEGVKMISLPDSITFNGSYQDISVESGFALSGSLEIDPNYDGFNIDFTKDQLETNDNYLGGVITLNGDLTNTSYDDVHLNVEVIRDGYQHGTSNFRYQFDSDKFIRGEMNAGANKEFNLVAYNEKDIKLDFKHYEGVEGKIGEITNYNGDKLFGEIIVDITTDEPRVDFNDGTSVSLLLQ